jgi:hypothetical protein
MPAGISPNLWAILQCAMALDVDDRYPTMAQLIADLRKERLALEALTRPERRPTPPAGFPPVAQLTLMPLTPIRSSAGELAPAGTFRYSSGDRPRPVAVPVRRPVAAAFYQKPRGMGLGGMIALAGATVLVAAVALFVLMRQPQSVSNTSLPPMASAVYDDTLEPGWDNASWGSRVNLFCTSTVHGGRFAIATTITAPFGALQLQNHNLNPAGYQSLSFWISGGPRGCQDLLVGAAARGSTATGTYGVAAIPPRTWVHEDVPLSALKMQTTPNCTSIWIQDQSHTAGQTFYVDDIAFKPT